MSSISAELFSCHYELEVCGTWPYAGWLLLVTNNVSVTALKSRTTPSRPWLMKK